MAAPGAPCSVAVATQASARPPCDGTSLRCTDLLILVGVILELHRFPACLVESAARVDLVGGCFEPCVFLRDRGHAGSGRRGSVHGRLFAQHGDGVLRFAFVRKLHRQLLCEPVLHHAVLLRDFGLDAVVRLLLVLGEVHLCRETLRGRGLSAEHRVVQLDLRGFDRVRHLLFCNSSARGSGASPRRTARASRSPRRGRRT